MRKLVVSSPRGEREIPLTENVFVGRDPACAIRDDDPQLSRRHAEFVAGRDGVVVVVKPGREFEQLAKNTLQDTTTASPAVAGGRIYLRGFNHLWAIGAK